MSICFDKIWSISDVPDLGIPTIKIGFDFLKVFLINNNVIQFYG